MHPDKLLSDVCVAGVQGTRFSDEKNMRAWIVLNEEGKKQGEKEVIAKLDKWVTENLSSYKRLKGGWAVVAEVNDTGPLFMSHKYSCEFHGRFREIRRASRCDVNSLLATRNR